MVKLSVNVNKIALIRNSRGGHHPDPIHAVQTILKSGANGITVHPRPDGRHITFCDVKSISKLLKHEYSDRELNLEGNPFDQREVGTGHYPGYLEMALASIPHQATLVPDQIDQLTSNHGWNLDRDATVLEPLILKLKNKNIRVSLFLDLECRSPRLAREIGADRVELYTEAYAQHYPTPQRTEIIKKYQDQAAEINSYGLELNAGHDLNQANLGYFIRKIPQIKEVSIGHALISESLYHGLSLTVTKYLNEIKHSEVR